MQTEPMQLVCPKCGVFDAIEQSSGKHLCLACMYEGEFVHRGGETLAVAPDAVIDVDGTILDTVPPLVPDTEDPDDDDGEDHARVLRSISDNGGVLAHVDNVGGDIDDATVAATPLAEPAPIKAGTFVHVEPLNRDGLVVDDDDKDSLVVEFPTGKRKTLARVDCAPIGDEDVITDRHGMAGHAVNETMLTEVMFAIASAILTAGADCVNDDDDRTFSAPSYGWAPPPANEVPEMELASAYAIAILIRHYDLDSNEVRTIAANLMTLASAETPNNTKGNNSDEAN